MTDEDGKTQGHGRWMSVAECQRLDKIDYDKRNHGCHYPGCSTTCSITYLFCQKHWQQVPRDLQMAVYSVKLRYGQCCGVNPQSPEFITARDNAVKAVQLLEDLGV